MKRKESQAQGDSITGSAPLIGCSPTVSVNGGQSGGNSKEHW